MNVTIRRGVYSVMLLLGSAAFVFAQAQPGQPRTAQPRGQTRPAGQPAAQAQQLEPSILTLLIIDNNKEVALGQLGQQTSQNEQVKEFCQMIIKDHSEFVQKLQEKSESGGRSPGLGFGVGRPQGETATRPLARPGNLAASKTAPGAQPSERTTTTRTETTTDATGREPTTEARTAENRDRSSSTAQQITVAKPVIGNQPGAQILQLHHEVAEACLKSARDEAQKHRGAEFDKHFMAAQVVAHQGMLDKLQVFERHVSPETAQLLSGAQEKTKQHLEHAKSICESLAKGGSSEKARTE